MSPSSEEKSEPTIVVESPPFHKTDSIAEPSEKGQEARIYDKAGSVTESSFEEPQYDFDSEEFANIPQLVRTVVGFEDDPTLPVITFRSVLLSAIFCIIGSFVSQLS